ncbi:MAG: ABC transporter permease subunit [Tissierellia bacterium]|nr:ABC transporter permease subunit [Tissierellia bacterium]
MINIIKSDLYRILKGKAIYIVLAVITILSVVSVVGMSPGHIGLSIGSNVDMSDLEMMEEISSAKTLGEYREIMKNNGSFALDKDIVVTNVNLYYFFIVIAVIVVATDFSNKSIKNTISSAISRKEYYFSKLLLILGLGTFLILFNNYGTYILNLIINGKAFSTPLLEFTKLTIIQLPLLYGIISLLVCLAFVLRKTSLFNSISIPFIMVVQLIATGIINLFKLNADWFNNYEIQLALTKLVNNPTNKYIVSCALLGIAYIVIFNTIGYYAFKKAEIK